MTQSRREFLEGRRGVIGGSDAGTIAGVNPWQTKAELYDSKVMPVVETGEHTPDQLRGILLEPVAVDRWKQETGRDVRKQPQRVHPDYPYIGANVDRQILAGQGRGTGLLEVKCPRSMTFHKYKASGLPEHIVLQMQHYLGVHGYEYGCFAIFGADDMELVSFEVERDDPLIEQLFALERRFWEEYIVPGVRPDDEDARIDYDIPSYDGELLVTDSEELVTALDNYLAARQFVREAEEIKAMAHEQAVAAFKAHDADAFDLPHAIVYHREQITRRFNQALLKARFPLDGHVVRKLLADTVLPTEFMERVIEESAIDIESLKKPSTSRPFRPYLKKPEDRRCLPTKASKEVSTP